MGSPPFAAAVGLPEPVVVEPHVHAVKTIYLVSTVLAGIAGDLAVVSSPERTRELVEELARLARTLQELAIDSPVRILEINRLVEILAAGRDHLTGDTRIAAALTHLAIELPPIAREVLGGVLDEQERHDLADTLTTIANDLRGNTDDAPMIPDSRMCRRSPVDR